MRKRLYWLSKMFALTGAVQEELLKLRECYRWVLSSPHVDVVLCGPRDAAEWRADLAALREGPLPEPELTWMREFGRAVHG